MKIYHLLLPIVFTINAFAQNLCGKVQKNNGEPIAFVSIVNAQNIKQGVLSDIEGRFCLKDFKGDTLIFSCIGYEKKRVATKDLQLSDWVLTLVESDNHLKEIVISSEENPANRLIKRVIKFQPINNPDERKRHQCTIYNKVWAEYLPDTAKLDSMNQVTTLSKLQKSQLMSAQKVTKNYEKQYLMLMESVTERSFEYPQKVQQKVILNRVSGFENPLFASLANDIQPFSFYGNEFRILHKFYHSPIATDALNYYDFILKDTLYIEKDTIYTVSFLPKPAKKFESLKGLLFINTKKYAIQNASVEPYESVPLTLKIEQKYQELSNGDWFPEQLNFVILFEKYPQKYMGMRFVGKSFVSNVRVDNLKNDIFNLNPTFIEKAAYKQPDTTWNKFRVLNLNERERNTYIKLDSLGKKHNSDLKFKLYNSLLQGDYRIGNINLDLKNTIKINEFEGLRIGVGAFTNNYFSKRFSIGGYYSYGLKDKDIKYGALAKVFIYPERGISVSVSTRSDLREIGDYQFVGERKEALQNIFASRFDKIQEFEILFNKSQKQGFKYGLGFSKSINTPLYDYGYSIDSKKRFEFTEFNVSLGYDNSQRITSMSQEGVYGRSKYPNFEILYTLGINTYEYNKLKISINQSAFVAKVGVIHYRIEGGWIDKPLPYGKLFTDNGARNSITSIALANTFKTILPYEFVSDKYIASFIRYDFPNTFFEHKYSKPSISLIQNFAYGTLHANTKHQLVSFKTMEKGLFESGMEVRNLLRFNYINFCKMGFGGGIYRRTGNYSNPTFKDNMAFRSILTMSF